ncbi:uncharacterized protein [Clytia hemisphaerica]|uniref:Cnidarian restricted protein n=1 Tax=Clytia hemisphaerica TaxID=252671 RepID=A0A7M5TRZ2_9CNID
MFQLAFVVSLFILAASANDCEKSTYEKLGCFKRQPKLLPDLILNDRDPTHDNYTGRNIDWVEYASYLNEFTCRCSDKAKKMGYKYFALGFYGECWAGKDMKEFVKVMNDFSQGSMKCINGNYWACDNMTTSPCTGGANTEYIYLVVGDDEEGEE